MLKTVFVALAVLVATATALTMEEAAPMFAEWKSLHGKEYSHMGEEQYRQAVWARNFEFIQHHNTLGKSYTVAMNEFGDLTHAEFSQIYLSTPMDVELWNATVSALPVAATRPLSSSNVDWRQKGAVGAVKNQGQCGSCWSFSATGSMEGVWQIAGHSLVSLSEQQLMDCSGKYGNMGCNGGLPGNAFLYVIDAGGIESEHDYPYQMKMNSQCKYDSSKAVAHFSNAYQVKQGNDDALAQSIEQYGPIAIAIDASQPSFQFYSSGIYKEPACSSTKLDHGVVAVGYTPNAWLVRNSWGSSWGEHGYIQMDRSVHDFCGVSTMAAFPQV